MYLLLIIECDKNSAQYINCHYLLNAPPKYVTEQLPKAHQH